MYVSLIQLHLIIFYRNVFAYIYNDICTTGCNFPGMMCAYGRCKCDWRLGLFWTGARCLSCPSNWSMSETTCLGFYGTEMSFSKAEATCQSMQADLISLRDNSILPLIYQITSGTTRRRKRAPAVKDTTLLWTSGRAIQLTNLGLYQWGDKRLQSFDSTHAWWCRIGIPHLGYYHTHREPSRLIFNNTAEQCILLRRGNSSVQMLCLDDVICDTQYPFICERSESTGEKYFGYGRMYNSSLVIYPFRIIRSIATNMGIINGSNNTTSKTSTNSYTSSGNNYGTSKDPSIIIEHHLGMLGNGDKSKSDRNTKTIIILVISLLLLVGSIGGVFLFMKNRNTTETQFHDGNNVKENQSSSIKSPSVISGTSVSSTNDQDELSSYRTGEGQDNLTSGVDIDNQKQQQSKRGGYSKQKFDELD